MAPEQAEGKAKEVGPRGRRLRPGRDPLRAADGPAAVPGRDDPGDPGAGEDGRAGAAVAAVPRPAARPRDDLPEVPAKGAGQALRSGRGSWPTTCAASRRASRSWRGRSAGWSGPGAGAGGTAVAAAVMAASRRLAGRRACRNERCDERDLRHPGRPRMRRRLSDHRRYLAEMDLARQAWQVGRIGRVQQYLQASMNRAVRAMTRSARFPGTISGGAAIWTSAPWTGHLADGP